MVYMKMSSTQRAYMAPTAVTISQNLNKYIQIKQRNNHAALFGSTSDKTSKGKSFSNSENTSANDSDGYSGRNAKRRHPLPVKVESKVAEIDTFKTLRQLPKVYDLSKLEYNNFNRNTDYIRQEILHDRILYRELADRIAEAKLSLTGIDLYKDRRSTNGDVDERHNSSLRNKDRVSFLSVGRRVANIIRFRQAAQPKKTGMPLNKEVSSVETTTLPKTPRFSSYMSPAAQYALMKGYEDIIFEKLSSKYPEYTGMLKRNKTPHHSIAISEMTNLSASELASCNDELGSDRDDEDRWIVGNFFNEKTIDSYSKKTDSEIASSERDYVSGSLPKLKGQLYASNKHNSEEPSELQKTIQSRLETLSGPALQPTNLQNINRISSFSTAVFNGDENMTDLSKYGKSDTSSESLPKLTAFTSNEHVGRNRRIHLSYRIENAMDILDRLKTMSEHALSPRVKIQPQQHITSVHDFNRWTDLWTSEFNHDAVK